MSTAANPTARPAEHDDARSDATRADLLSSLVMGETFVAALRDVASQLVRLRAVSGVEWWTWNDGEASPRLELSTGTANGPRTSIPIGQAGTLVLVGKHVADAAATIGQLRPFLRRRWTEEQLAGRAARLARTNEALEDLAALLAHDLRSSLVIALRMDEPRDGVTRAIELVDSILEAVRLDDLDGGVALIAECVQEATADLAGSRVEVISDAAGEFAMPFAALRLVLRNLLANAVAAGARCIRVSTIARGERRALVVDDDGVGLSSTGRYATGHGLGLALSRRLLSRFGAVVELEPGPVGGTRALIVVGADA